MLSIILPAYNEEENIEEAVRGAFEFLRTLRIPFELIIVNDGSKDKTGMILQELRSRYTNLVIIQHVQNLGKGAALISGFTKAQGELVFFTDSDQQVKITELKNFLNQIDSYDFAVGYRLKRQDPWHRRLLSLIFHLIGHFLFGIRVRDFNCPAKLFRAEMIKSLPLESRGFLIDLEIFALARKKGFKFRELPVTHFPRLKGKPLSSFNQVFESLFGIFKLWRRLRNI